MASTYSPLTVLSNVGSNILSNNTTDHFSAAFGTKNDVVPYKWLSLVLLLLTPLFVGSARYFLFHDRPPKGLKLIGGPPSTIPYVGRVDIDADAPWHTMRKWADEYKGMFRLTMCGVMHIWLGDTDLAQEFFCKRAAKYSSRPEFFAVPGSHNQAQYLPLLEYGDHWRVQRKFAHTALNMAYNNQFYGYMTLETKLFLWKLLNDPEDHYAQTDRLAGRISARLCYGSANSAAAHCMNAAQFIPQIGPTSSGPITNILPFLGKLPEWINTSKKVVRQRREREERFWKGLMLQVKKEMDDGTAPVSFARSYYERKAEEAAGTGKSFGFDDHEAAYTVGMLCTVAIFTVGGPLYCFFLAMVLHPEWQEKCRAEVDAVVGHDRIVTVEDSPNLPIVRACVKECLRWRPLVPLGVPRLVQEDDEFEGYYIPKGAVLHAVDLSMARDTRMYPDPETYNPGRWLEPGWPTYEEPLTVYPRLLGFHGFGRGRRVCPGIETSEAELLVACGSLLWAFTMTPKIGADGKPRLPDPDKWTSNVIGGPLPFEFDLRVRNDQRKAKIEEMYSDNEHLF